MKTLLICIGLIFSASIFSQNIKDAENLINSERFDDAYNLLLSIKASDNKNPYVNFLLGETVLKSYINDPYSDTKNKAAKKALASFNEGIKTDSLNPLNFVGRGIIELFRNNDSTKADSYFKTAMLLLPHKKSGTLLTNKKKFSDLHIKTLLKLETAELFSTSPRFEKCDYYNAILRVLQPDIPEVYIAYGNILLAQSKASDAIAQYKKALYIEKDALTNVMVGKIYIMARNNEEAKNYFEAALKLDSMFAPAYKGLGDVYYKNKKNKLAKKNYAKFLELTGNNIPAKINYIKALYKAKDYEGTISIARDILKVDSSKYFIYRIAGFSFADKDNPDYERALKYMNKFMAKVNNEDIIQKDYQYLSKIHLSLNRDSNDIRMGVEMLEKAYLMDTTDNEALVDLIKTSFFNKMYDIEIKYLTKKINSGDDTPGNYMLLGKAYFYNKNYTKADTIFTLVTTLDTANIDAYKWKTYALSSLDPDLKEGIAKPAFEKFLEVTASSPDEFKKERFDAYSYLGSYYMFSKELNYDKAIEQIKNSLTVDPENNQLQLKGYYTLAFAYYKAKQWNNAKNAYETILKLKPDDTNAPKALKDINKYLDATK
jgi:tetratricopeptide (TPR) repeat protein